MKISISRISFSGLLDRGEERTCTNTLYIIEYNEVGLAPRGAERVGAMTEIGLIRYASGDWTPGNPYVRVRIEADELEEPQAFRSRSATSGHSSRCFWG
jgi:hypothetical protein